MKSVLSNLNFNIFPIIFSLLIGFSFNHQSYADIYSSSDSVMAESMSKSDAVKLGINFVNYISSKEDVEWVYAKKFFVEDVQDIRGELQGYEISIFDENNMPLGYVMVPTKGGFGVVSKFNYSDKSKSDFLKEKLETDWKPLVTSHGMKIVSTKLIGDKHGFWGLAIKTDKPNLNLPTATTFEDYYIFTLNPMQNVLDLLENNNISNSASYRTLTPDTQNKNIEEDKVRLQLINGQINYSTRSVGGSSPSTGQVSGDFSPYNQEKNLWSHGYCYTGCTPVAFGILIEYWDRNGYGLLLGLDDSKRYSNYKNFVVRDALNTIASILGTHCTSSQSGATPVSNNPKILEYTKQKGYNSWRAYNSSYGKANAQAWDYLTNEIKNKRPTIASVGVNGESGYANHTVVAYSYSDYDGEALDSFCYRTGWGTSPASDCMTRATHFSTTVVQPKKDSWWQWW